MNETFTQSHVSIGDRTLSVADEKSISDFFAQWRVSPLGHSQNLLPLYQRWVRRLEKSDLQAHEGLAPLPSTCLPACTSRKLSRMLQRIFVALGLLVVFSWVFLSFWVFA
jgi:hypothetical protein